MEDTPDAGMDGAVYLDMQGGNSNVGDSQGGISGDVNLYSKSNGQGDAVTQEPTAVGAHGHGPGPGGPGLPKGWSHHLITHPLITVMHPLLTITRLFSTHSLLLCTHSLLLRTYLAPTHYYDALIMHPFITPPYW